MTRVEAHELVVHGLKCDNVGCEILLHTRNSTSKPEGFYLSLERVTESGNSRKNEDLFFCSKECLVSSMKWDLSSLLT